MAWLRLFALITINIIIALFWLGVLAWLVGRVLTDRFAWSQWMWWIPTPAVIMGSIVGLVLSHRPASAPGRRRRRVIAWSVCALSLTMYFTFIEHRLLRGPPPIPEPGTSLRVAHWNMTLDTYSPLDLLLKSVADFNADVTVITSPPSEVRRELCRQADASEGRLHVYNAWPMFVLSRVPIVRVRVLVASDQRCVTAIELNTETMFGRTIVMDLVDMPSNPRVPRMQMAREVRGLLDETTAPPPDIVVGDFNIPRGSSSISVMFPGLRDAFNIAGHGSGASFPRRLPLYHIDHVLVNERAGLTAARYDLIDEGLGRHRAQKAWIVNR